MFLYPFSINWRKSIMSLEKIKFYEISEEYINFLRKFDKRVMSPKAEDREHTRKYIGIILDIKGFKYFVPLSSYKDNHDNFNERIDFIKVMEKNAETKYHKYAVLYMNNMIPVPDCAIIEFDFDDIEDEAYRGLLIREYLVCVETEKSKQIRDSARQVYNTKVNIPTNKLSVRCCDFKLLEIKSLEYAQIKANLLKKEE